MEFRPILIDTASDDQDDRLIMIDGWLVGIVVRIGAEGAGDLGGRWFLKVGFGDLELADPESFVGLPEVQAWVVETRRAGARSWGR